MTLTAWSCGAGAASPVAVEAAHDMVVSAQRLASEAGAQILAAGGNAVDAAVAVGYAEAVTNPCCANIGGGGFMVLHLATTGRDVFIDFRETAPHAAARTMYLDASGRPRRRASLDGYLAVAVPGTVLGLDTALRRYGSLSRAVVMRPAIKLARDGFVLTRADTDILDAGAARLRRDPEARRVFFRADGSALRPGDRLRQPELADTLEAIARDGPDAFYRSAIADRISTAEREHGGILTDQDLANYRVTQSAPIACAYRGYRILSAPPPSSGGTTLCEILQILAGYDLRSLGFHSAASIHYMVEAMRRAYRDRNTYLGDPAFVQNPLGRLLSASYAAALRVQIAPERATPSKDLPVDPELSAIAHSQRMRGAAPLEKPPIEKPETTHYSIIDRRGNAVSVTYTINGLFGAGVIAPGTGFLLNDEMDDFTSKPGVPNAFGLVQGDANAIAPGKRPLSSMAPTLVTKDGRVVTVVGSPGGPRIISVTLQVILNLIDYGMSPQEAVDAPRIHHQWLPDEIVAEPYALSPDTVRLLEDWGYKVTTQAPWGAAELIALPGAGSDASWPSPGSDPAFGQSMRPGFIYGANDDRRPAGAAVGN